jgi:hypothetical protein
MLKDILEIYKNDLWKDKRLLDPQKDVFIKQSENIEENKTEISILRHLKEVGISNVPQIIKTDGLNIYMQNYKGIRVFELLVQLDELYIKCNIDKAKYIKKIILDRCNKNQKEIQLALIDWRKNRANRKPYPQFKLNSIIKVLTECTQIMYNEKSLQYELNKINNYWAEVVNVPFRDAATKNMVFADPRLSRIEINPSKDKTLATRNIVESWINNEDFWQQTPINDFDFSSCINDTTYEDDYISLNFFERSFNGNFYVLPEDLLWTGKPDNKRAAITFLVRYYRFGGRKAAYRLLNPINHMIRFAYDDDVFYFRNLSLIMRHLWEDVDNEIPLIIELTDKIAKKLAMKTVQKDAFYERYQDAHREPWSGMRDRVGE